MSASESAEEAKNAGTAAFKAADYSAAVAHYTLAIEADPTDHVLFSNRSAAYAKQEKYKEALLDANKCIDLNPAWARGHSRRGAAYVGLRNWRAALGAYEEGLKIEPANAAMKQEVASISARLNGSGTSSGGSGGPFAHAQLVVPGAIEGATILNASIALCAFFYFVPVLGALRAHFCYKMAFGATLAITVLGLWRTWPKTFATLKDPRFHAAPEVSLALLCFLLQMAPPMPFALVPHACYAAHNTLRVHSPRLMPRFPSFLKERAMWLLSEEGTQMTLAFGAISEVIVAVMSPLTVLMQGVRGIATSYLFIQYLNKRYKTSQWTQLAVNSCIEKLDGAMHHRFVPAAIGGLYDKLKAALQKFVR